MVNTQLLKESKFWLEGKILLRYARLYIGRLTLYFTMTEKIQGRRDSRLLSILLMRNAMRTQLGRQLTP